MFKHDRILRNEEGGSPGGGTAPPAPPTPPSDPGTPAPAAPVIPVDALKSAVAEALTGALPKLRDGIFADLRKSGALRKDPESPPPAAAPASTGLSAADVEAMLERERVITARATKHNLGDAAVRRLKASLTGVSPENFATEADSFLADLGLVKAPTAATPAPTPAQPSNPQPISDKGSPAPGGVLDWEREYAENPIGMSVAARSAMDAKYGKEKAQRMRVERALERGAGIRVKAQP